MKRHSKLLALLTVTVVGVFLVAAPPAFARDPDASAGQTQAEATACAKKWGGKKYYRADPKYAEKLEKFNNDDCEYSNGGNCSTVSKGTGSGAYLLVKCGKNPHTFPGPTDGGGEDICDTDCQEGFTDQAVDAATCNKNECELLAKYLNPFIKLLSYLVGIAVVIGIMIGAIQVITSAGDPQKNANGKNHIRNALIAAIAYVILFAFLQWVIPGGVT